MKWSNYQTAIFNFVENETGNAVVEAVAGSGKTTTLVEAIKRVAGTSIFLAFNKSIAEELKARGVNARTFHSLTYGATMRHVNARSVTDNKTSKVLGQHLSPDNAFLYMRFLSRLIGLGKQMGIGCLIPNIEASWAQIIDHHNLELSDEKAEISVAIELAIKGLKWCNESNMIDFDDMLYLPVLHGMSLPKFDVVFVDEAQDTNAIQRALLRKLLKPNSRVVAVGDPAQAIYGFRGADSDSLNRIATEFNCEVFPLSVSYRCATSIVEYARQWVQHIQPSETAPAGLVTHLDKWDATIFTPKDLVVCRTTKPLVALAFSMLRDRIPVTILGREIGEGLVKLIKSFKTNDLSSLENKLHDWSDREMEKAIAAQQESKADAIDDKTHCILNMIAQVQNEEGDVNSLIAIIEELFQAREHVTTLCTIHKAKGLEADKVYWLNSSECPSKWAKSSWAKKQEANLCYVATTRAKTELVLIEG